MNESENNLGFKRKIMHNNITNDILKEYYKDIVINKNERLLPFLEDICYKIDLYSVIDNTEIFILSIYYENKTSFDIFLERGININKIMKINNQSFYNLIIPLFVALSNNNDYFINKLIEKPEIEFFMETDYRNNNKKFKINVITYLCESITNLELFNNILNKLFEISEVKVLTMIYNRPNTFIADCLFGYFLNKNKHLLFSKLELLIHVNNRMNNYLSRLNFFENLIIQNNLKEISVELYYFFKKHLKKLKIKNHILLATKCNDINLLKVFHNEGYKLNSNSVYSPLNIAMMNNFEEIIYYLLNNGVEFNFTNKRLKKKYYENLFHIIMNDNISLFKYLSKYFDIFHEYEKKIEVVNLYYRPIHIAFAYRSINIILFLMDNGECINYKGNCIYSPLEVGIKNGISKIEISLLSLKFKTLFDLYKETKYIINDKCSICLCNIQNDNIVKLKCNHLFHKKCIIQCMKHSDKCPYCRQDLLLDSLVFKNLCIISKKHKKRKRYNSLNIENEKSIINNIKYLDDTNLENLKIKLYKPKISYEKWQEKHEKLKKKLETNDYYRKLKEIKNILMKSECINFKNKRIRIYTFDNPPPSPNKIKIKRKTEIQKLGNWIKNINLSKRKSKKPDRFGY